MKPQIRIEIKSGIVTYIAANCDCEIQILDHDEREIDLDRYFPDEVYPDGESVFAKDITD